MGGGSSTTIYEEWDSIDTLKAGEDIISKTPNADQKDECPQRGKTLRW